MPQSRGSFSAPWEISQVSGPVAGRYIFRPLDRLGGDVAGWKN